MSHLPCAVGVSRASRNLFEPCRLQGGPLPRRQSIHLETVDQAMEEAMPVDFGTQPHEDGAEADGGAVHQHEFARRAAPG